ncbi:hypothetical protein HPHPP25_1314 [Helicobacter pylori Hp P-25]|nr:hypothetical protein HPHPP25_1314 [Helicobacter pylori Hp P-25]EJC34600.1 hypothetical protein HPHPP25C_1169 [Helicobacter pylori Hp P-25c]EJC36879.1 hypothetical protein HPHPP25D_1357 [Helicobacter pylori Hp P-25d]
MFLKNKIVIITKKVLFLEKDFSRLLYFIMSPLTPLKTP